MENVQEVPEIERNFKGGWILWVHCETETWITTRSKTARFSSLRGKPSIRNLSLLLFSIAFWSNLTVTSDGTIFPSSIIFCIIVLIPTRTPNKVQMLIAFNTRRLHLLPTCLYQKTATIQLHSLGQLYKSLGSCTTTTTPKEMNWAACKVSQSEQHTHFQTQNWSLPSTNHQHWDVQSHNPSQFWRIVCPFHSLDHLPTIKQGRSDSKAYPNDRGLL